MSNTAIDDYNTHLGYHPSVIPLDIRLGLTTAPSDDKPADSHDSPGANDSPGAKDPSSPQALRWGVLATGKVAHDFTQVLKFLSLTARRHAIVAVGSRTQVRASEFASLHSIPAAYGSYEELCADPNVDIVYVASLHPDHRTHAEMALLNGKHVLVEKPICMKASDAQYLYDLGKEKNLFVGEGMWTRFFPAVEWARMRMGHSDVSDASSDVESIGRVRVVQADFSIDGDDVGPYPIDSIYARDLGGGTIYTMGPYVIAAAMMPFGKEPETIAANGILSNDGEDVGELAVGMTMVFKTEGKFSRSASSPPSAMSMASGMVTYLAESSEETMYAGKGGRITLLGPAHCPTKACLKTKQSGRGNGASSSTEGGDTDKTATETSTSNDIIVEFPLPASLPEIEASSGIQMPNSMGFIYEAETVRRLIAAGQTTFPQWTPKESIGCLRTLEKALEQINKI